ncbi:MAG: protein kinase [Kiritimatiellae bacterium]|nr:protein kinase [Kiritimatiellia bacterium]
MAGGPNENEQMPDAVGPYTILEQIGRGGMATVYRARGPNNGLVALKVLHVHQALDPRQLERFRREGALVSGIAHPNVMRVIDIGEADGRPYIAMELVEGMTVAQTVRSQGALGFRDAAYVAAQVAAGLGAIHEKGFLHRDVKPSNILVGEDGIPKLGDFGVARLVEQAEDDRLTMTEAAVGTPYYMSPEQARGRGGLGPESDVYSLGVVLYEMLAGGHPFGDATSAEAMVRHVSEAFPPIRRFRSDIPDDLEHALRRCLHKEPDDRFRNGAELHRALEHVRLRLETEQQQQPAATGEYEARVTGTGFFYVDATASAPSRGWRCDCRALLGEILAQVRDPNQRKRGQHRRLHRRCLAARRQYKRAEADFNDLRRRAEYHRDKAEAARRQSEQAVAQSDSNEADIAARDEREHTGKALDCEHQAAQLGKRVGMMRDRYDELRRRQGELAEELALMDAEARAVGKPIPAFRHDPKLARKAVLARHGVLCFLIGLLALVWGAKYVRARRPLPTVAAPAVADPAAHERKEDPFRPLSDGLVLYYSFNEETGKTVRDQSGLGNDGELVDGTWIANGLAGGSMEFDGKDDVIETREHDSLQIRGDVSYGLWLKLGTNRAHGRGILICGSRKDGPGTCAQYNLFHKDKDRLMGSHQYSGEQGVYLFQDSKVLSPDEWHHVMVVRDASEKTARYYVDGELNTESKYVNDPGDGSATHLTIGHAYGYLSGPSHFHGWMDEIRIYNRALSEKEIRRLFTLRPGEGPQLVLHYGFDETTGETVRDLAGGGNTGQIHGAKRVEGGVFGRAMQFDGHGYVERVYDKTSAAFPQTNSFSVSAWFQTHCTAAREQSVVATHFCGYGCDGFFMSVNTKIGEGHLFWFVGASNQTFARIRSQKPVNDGQWHHAVGVWDRHRIMLYVDGVFQGHLPAAGKLRYRFKAPLRVGHAKNNNAAPYSKDSLYYFEGTIDDVRVYNGVLSADDVRGLWTKRRTT